MADKMPDNITLNHFLVLPIKVSDFFNLETARSHFLYHIDNYKLTIVLSKGRSG